jgi:hypothetical protein
MSETGWNGGHCPRVRALGVAAKAIDAPNSTDRIVGILADREINPVPVPVDGDDDLVSSDCPSD